MKDLPNSITYSLVVSHYSLRIEFMIAALNGLDILAADIGNAYPNAPCYGKVYFTAGAEFGNRKYAHEIVVHAMYGLKYNGDAQISH